jgi:hypothetical protein
LVKWRIKEIQTNKEKGGGVDDGIVAKQMIM